MLQGGSACPSYGPAPPTDGVLILAEGGGGGGGARPPWPYARSAPVCCYPGPALQSEYCHKCTMFLRSLV